MDQPISGIEKVVWWTEYVIRNGGAKHLRNPAADLPWYQYLLLDVTAAFFTFLGTLAIVLILLWKILRTVLIISWKIVKKICSSAILMETSTKKDGISKRSKKTKTL